MIAGVSRATVLPHERAGRGRRHVPALLVSVLAAALGICPAASAAVLTGVADQRPGFLHSPAYRALDISAVRLVIPWDAGVRAGPWDSWIDQALDEGAQVQVALEHAERSSCPASPCSLPSTVAYGDALQALLARYPAIHEITAWNEPNHDSQPTFRDPAAAAGYYEEARARCPACTVVAGDFLDDGALAGYMSGYKAALTSTPAVWGVHNYFDATYFESRGVETMLRETSGALWLNETGGIVSFTPAGGGGLPYDEQRAADSVRWLYDLADRRPAIERMYLYQWQGARDNGFDAGLLGYDGTPRPAYDVVAARVGRRGGLSPVAGGVPPAGIPSSSPEGGAGAQIGGRGVVLAAPGANAALRPGRRLRLLPGGRLEVQARCVARRPGAARCRQRLVLRVAGRVVARLRVDVGVRHRFTRVLRLPRWAARGLLRARPRRVQLQSCAVSGRMCGRRVTALVALSGATMPVRVR